jgi:hypothetical protein
MISGFEFFDKENREIPEKTNFCAYVGRSLHGKRGRFFEKLNSYKRIETNVSPYNDFTIPFDNTGFNSSAPKINFIKKYKFNLAFENNWRGTYPSHPNAIIENGELLDMNGYTTEKLLEPLISGVIPIYWGNKTIHTEYNSKTFLNYYDFAHEDDLINKIIELDNNDKLYNSYFKNKLKAETYTDVFNIKYLSGLFDKIVEKIKQ